LSKPPSLAERLLEISREIVEAEARVAALKAQFTQLVEQARQVTTAPAMPSPNAIWFDGGTLGDRAAGFINQRPLELLDAPTIASGLGLPPERVPTLRTTLNRLVERKAITSPVRGAFTSNTAEVFDALLPPNKEDPK
jgi:hypothetical protein